MLTKELKLELEEMQLAFAIVKDGSAYKKVVNINDPNAFIDLFRGMKSTFKALNININISVHTYSGNRYCIELDNAEAIKGKEYA